MALPGQPLAVQKHTRSRTASPPAQTPSENLCLRSPCGSAAHISRIPVAPQRRAAAGHIRASGDREEASVIGPGEGRCGIGPSPRFQGIDNLAAHHRSHPAAPGSPSDRGPASPVGEGGCTGPAHSRPGPTRVSEPAPCTRSTGRCTQTRSARPRTSTRDPQSPPRTPLRRGKDHQTRPHLRRPTTIRRLKNKIRDPESIGCQPCRSRDR